MIPKAFGRLIPMVLRLIEQGFDCLKFHAAHFPKNLSCDRPSVIKLSDTRGVDGGSQA